MASVAQILLSPFEAVPNSEYMRSVAAWAAAITPASAPSWGWMILPSLWLSRSRTSRITTFLSFGTTRFNKRELLPSFGIVIGIVLSPRIPAILQGSRKLWVHIYLGAPHPGAGAFLGFSSGIADVCARLRLLRMTIKTKSNGQECPPTKQKITSRKDFS